MKKFSLKLLISLALLTAINLLLARVFVIYITDFVRLDLGSVPIMLAGLFFGPVAGALTGSAADLLGALISGRGWYPPLTLGPLFIGLISGLFRPFLRKHASLLRTALVIAVCDLTASVFCKTWLLSGLYGISYGACLAARIPAIIGVGIVEALVVYILYTRLPRDLLPKE